MFFIANILMSSGKKDIHCSCFPVEFLHQNSFLWNTHVGLLLEQRNGISSTHSLTTYPDLIEFEHISVSSKIESDLEPPPVSKPEDGSKLGWHFHPQGLIKWVPGIFGDLLVKSKLFTCCGSMILRHVNPIHTVKLFWKSYFKLLKVSVIQMMNDFMANNFMILIHCEHVKNLS